MKKRQKKSHRMKTRHRNAGPLAVAPRRRVRLPRRGAPPDWRTTLAAVAGGAGSAALGGLVVNQQILSPEAVGIGMIGVGGATAYFADGNTRVLGNSVAAAGAGQLALALMAKRALVGDRVAAAAAPTRPMAAPPQLPAPAPATAPVPAAAPPTATRRSADGGSVVLDLFRDAAVDIAELDEDEWRYGTRDAAGAGEIDVYDIDLDAAA